MKLKLLIFTLLLFSTACLAQNPSRIALRCPSPYSTLLGNVTVIANGNVTYTPCPAKKNIFNTGSVFTSGTTVDFTGATVIGFNPVNSFPLHAPDGTALAPSYSFASSTGTGFYQSTIGEIGFTSEGVDAITFNGGGIVSPTYAANQGTLTALQVGFSHTATWNNAGVTFTGLKSNVTNTASNAASLLFDLQVGSVSRFSVNQAGNFAVHTGGINLFQNATNDATFSGSIRASKTSTGIVSFGSSAGQQLSLSEATGTSDLISVNSSVRLGDPAGAGNGTALVISDSTKNFFFQSTTNAGILDTTGVSNIKLQRTITTAGTTGNQTINLPNGSVNIAAGQSSIVITNSTVGTSSLIIATANTADATCAVKNAVATSTHITITMTATCTAETRVAFWVTN